LLGSQPCSDTKLIRAHGKLKKNDRYLIDNESN